MRSFALTRLPARAVLTNDKYVSLVGTWPVIAYAAGGGWSAVVAVPVVALLGIISRCVPSCSIHACLQHPAGGELSALWGAAEGEQDGQQSWRCLS